MSTLTKNDKAKVYVGGLTPGIQEEDIRTHFKKYFPVRMELKVANGFAFVEFEEECDATDAIKYMDGTTLCDRRISVRPCGPPRVYGAHGPQQGGGGGGGGGGYPDRGPPPFRGPPGGEQRGGPPPPGFDRERDRFNDRGPPPQDRFHDRGPPPHDRFNDRGPPPERFNDRGPPPPFNDRFGGPPPMGGDRQDRRGNAPSGGGFAHGFRIEVENLGERTSWQDLKDFGRQAGGSIKYADVFQDDGKGMGKTGVISFALKEEAERAISILHEQTLDGSVVRVYEDRGTHPPKGSQQTGGGGDRYPQRGGPPHGDRFGGGDRFPPNDRFGPRGGFGGPDRGFGGPPPPQHPYERQARRRSPSPQRDRRAAPGGGGRSRSRSRERHDRYDPSLPLPPPGMPPAGYPRDAYPLPPPPQAMHGGYPRDRSPPPRRRSRSPPGGGLPMQDDRRRHSPERSPLPPMPYSDAPQRDSRDRSPPPHGRR